MRVPAKKKRLLHITTVPMTLRFLRGQVGFMKEHGYEVEIACSPGEELETFGREEGVAVHEVPMERQIAPLQDLVSLARLWREIRSVNPEIVHSHTPKAGLLGMFAATLAGVPVRCYHLRGLPMMSATGPRRTLLRWTERLSCTLAHQVFCVSHSLRDVAVEERLCSATKLQVLAGGSGNGVDSEGEYNPTRFAPNAGTLIRQQLDIPEDSHVIGFVGRLVRDKGIVELAEAWTQLRETHPRAVLLLIGPRELADAVPSEVLRCLDTDSRVKCTGMVPSAAPYYPAMDLLVLPTCREGFPNVLLEAAAMKLPIVATNVSGCVDAVESGVTGLLVPQQDSGAFAEGVATYLDSEQLRRRHGELGRRRVLEQFAQRKIWHELTGAYTIGKLESGYVNGFRQLCGLLVSAQASLLGRSG